MQKNVFEILKATLAAVVVALASVLIFTLIIQLFSLPSSAIKPVNQVLKIISIAAGGLIFLRGDKGLIKGVIFGLAAVILTYLLFSAIARSWNFTWKFLLELLLGAVAGGVTGIISVNVKK